MIIIADIKLNLKDKEVNEAVIKAAKLVLKDTVTNIASDSIKGSPKRTGNNMRSIKYEVGPKGEIAKEELSGAVYSTSGYGGYLEVGTVRMNPRPYFKPALDKNFTREKFANSIKGYLK